MAIDRSNVSDRLFTGIFTVAILSVYFGHAHAEQQTWPLSRNHQTAHKTDS
jgi:hypothetical protein